MVEFTYSFMNAGTPIYNLDTIGDGPFNGPTGADSLEIRDHYWSGYDDNPPADWERVGATAAEFTGEIGEAFREWKELFSSAFPGVTVNFTNLGYEGTDGAAADARTVPSPWPYYKELFDCDECGDPQVTGYGIRWILFL